MRGLGRAGIGLLALLGVTLGCGKQEEIIVQTAGEHQTSDDVINRDPIAVLPSGAVAVAYLDAPQLFTSAFGARLLAISQNLMPLPPSAGFEPNRDLSRIYLGLYSMQGADFVAVAKGRFDPAAFARAAESTEQTPLGAPVVKSSYAGRDLYTSRNIGFVALTPETLLVGNETALRRALDRIQEGRVRRQMPAFMLEMLDSPTAPIAVAADLRQQAVTQAASRELAFLNGLETLRAVGNFEPPGINLVGTMTYADEQAAAQGASSLQQSQQLLQSYGWIMAIIGIAQPIRQLEARASGKSAQFALGVDGAAVGTLLDQLQNYLATPSQPGQLPAK
ncbi:MAG TPA: hypothetical protein VKZ49_13585 [Polyangiaceae bacterium]|nr:hypothetical protein [Polyangiaceae bacterium]